MATRSHILAWKIPQTEDPGGLQSMGSPRVRHEQACTHARSRAKSGQRAETSIQFGFKKKKNLHRLGASSNWQDQRIRAEPNQCATQRGWEESSG